MNRLVAAALVLTGSIGCVSIPADAFRLARTYTPHVDRLSVQGFDRKKWVQTGQQVGRVGGAAVGLDQYSLVPTSDLTAMRYLLENTGCIRVVDEHASSPDRIEGSVSAGRSLGVAVTLARLAEWLTLLPLFGLPYPNRVAAEATSRLYLGDQVTRSYSAARTFSFVTTLYTGRGDQNRGVFLVRSQTLPGPSRSDRSGFVRRAIGDRTPLKRHRAETSTPNRARALFAARRVAFPRQAIVEPDGRRE